MRVWALEETLLRDSTNAWVVSVRARKSGPWWTGLTLKSPMSGAISRDSRSRPEPKLQGLQASQEASLPSFTLTRLAWPRHPSVSPRGRFQALNLLTSREQPVRTS